MFTDIKNFEGYYQINEEGQIRSIDREVPCGNHIRTYKGRILKPNIGTNGYYYVILSKGGNGKTCYVHNVMADTYLKKPNDNCEIDHINGNKLDNRLENLRYLDRHTNASLGGKKKGYVSHKSGENPKARKVTCINTGEEFGCIKDFAKKYNINYSTIRNKIRKGERNFNGYGINFN